MDSKDVYRSESVLNDAMDKLKLVRDYMVLVYPERIFWELSVTKNLPRQPALDGVNCGVFMCQFAEAVTREAPIILRDDIEVMRNIMRTEIRDRVLNLRGIGQNLQPSYIQRILLEHYKSDHDEPEVAEEEVKKMTDYQDDGLSAVLSDLELERESFLKEEERLVYPEELSSRIVVQRKVVEEEENNDSNQTVEEDDDNLWAIFADPWLDGEGGWKEEEPLVYPEEIPSRIIIRKKDIEEIDEESDEMDQDDRQWKRINKGSGLE